MPELPTITVTDEQATRMLAAFGSAEAYREWLVEGIKDYVVTQERQAINQRYEEARQGEIDALVASLEVKSP